MSRRPSFTAQCSPAGRTSTSCKATVSWIIAIPIEDWLFSDGTQPTTTAHRRSSSRPGRSGSPPCRFITGYCSRLSLTIDNWLYFSARGNQWNLYMGGNPASIDNKVYGSYWLLIDLPYACQGTVMAQGSFSFYVTCQFDFTTWPNDEHVSTVVRHLLILLSGNKISPRLP